jgi:hypothetical protein
MDDKPESDTVEKINKVALQAIDKEMDYENLIEKEELQKERDMDQELNVEMEKEKKKEQCIEKAIKEREIENQYNLKSKGQKDQMDEVKSQVKKQVDIRRSELKRKLNKYRIVAQRRLDAKSGEIQSIRIEIADKLAKAYRKGDLTRCAKAIRSDKEWVSYCKAEFYTNFQDYKSCENDEDRCGSCCEREFGDIFIVEKENCLEKLCKRKASGSFVNGKWIWETSSDISLNKSSSFLDPVTDKPIQKNGKDLANLDVEPKL